MQYWKGARWARIELAGLPLLGRLDRLAGRFLGVKVHCALSASSRPSAVGTTSAGPPPAACTARMVSDSVEVAPVDAGHLESWKTSMRSMPRFSSYEKRVSLWQSEQR